MARSRLLGLVILFGSLAIGVFAVMQMAKRVAAYNEQAHYGHFRFDVSTSRQFRAHGMPVTLTDTDDAKGDGLGQLRIEYGEHTKVVPVVEPPATGVPELGVYPDWLKVLEIHEVIRGPEGSLMDKEGSGRIVLVARVPPPGYDPETWGAVRRADWTFDFHEFMADGTIASQTYRWPRSAIGEIGLKKEMEKGDETAKILSAIPPLEERSWEYQAALHVIPKLNVPKYRFKDTAMRGMGWTLPVAGFSVLGVLVGIGLAVAPRGLRRAKRESSEPQA